MKKGFLNQVVLSQRAQQEPKSSSTLLPTESISVTRKSSSCCIPAKDIYCQTCDLDEVAKSTINKDKRLKRSDVLKHFDYVMSGKDTNDEIEKSMKIILRTLLSDILDDKMMAYRSNHVLQGTFARLVDTQLSFLDTLFPGVTSEAISTLPKSIHELLLTNIFLIDYIKVIESAGNVFRKVKEKGVARGDIMDRQTQIVLSNQILQEAFAREVQDSVLRMGKQLSHLRTQEAAVLALPPHENEDMYGHFNGFSSDKFSNELIVFIPQFLGAEWSTLIYEDCIRFLENEHTSLMSNWRETHTVGDAENDGVAQDPESLLNEMNRRIHGATQSTETARMSWVEREGLVELYPALAEAVGQMHMWPFEINVRTECAMKLLKPMSGCTMLVYYPLGACQPVRLDCNPLGDIDSKLRLSCSYSIGRSSSDSSPLSECVYSLIEEVGASGPTCADTISSFVRSFEVYNDCLTLHHSTKVQNGRARAACEHFVLYYFCHGDLQNLN